MKNHFFNGYAGNKRQEVELIFDNYIIKKYDSILRQENNIIIEPFCGTCALSFYLSTKYPKHFKYILNDNNNFLIELLTIAKDEQKLKDFETKINNIAKTLTKEKYYETIKGNSLEAYFIKNKIYCLKAGLFPLNYKYKYINLVNCPIVKFLRTEDIELYNIDALEIINKYKDNKDAYIFLDPPYLQTEKSFYKSPTAKIYEFISENPLNNFNAQFFLILENNWIIKLLFKCYKFIEYNKKYTTFNKRSTTHILISSKPILVNGIYINIDDNN